MEANSKVNKSLKKSKWSKNFTFSVLLISSCPEVRDSSHPRQESMKILSVDNGGDKEIGHFCRDEAIEAENDDKSKDEIVVNFESKIKLVLMNWNGSTIGVNFRPRRKFFFIMKIKHLH